MRIPKNPSKLPHLITRHATKFVTIGLLALVLSWSLSGSAGAAAGNRGPKSALNARLATTQATAADLAVGSVDVSALTTHAQTLVIIGSVRIEIQNQGAGASAGQFTVLLFEDRNNNGTYQSGVDSVLGTESFTGSIDSNAVAQLDVRVSGVVQFRDSPVHAFVDSANQVSETDEGNNIGNSGRESKYHPPAGDFQPKVKWEWQDPRGSNGVYHAPLVAPLIDTNGDGLINERDVPAVILATRLSPRSELVALRGDTGAQIFAVPNPRPEAWASGPGHTPAVGDIDGDGKPEIIIAGFFRNPLYAFNNDGTLKWTLDNRNALDTEAPNVTLADLDADGKSEIIFGRSVVNFDGTIRWTRQQLPNYEGAFAGGQQVVDLDLDGTPEIIAGASALDLNGNNVWSWRTLFSGGNWTATGTLDQGATTVSFTSNFSLADAYTAVANLDDDPNPEIIAISDDRTGVSASTVSDTMWIFEHDGRLKAGPIGLFQQTPNQLVFDLGAPAVADFDGDGLPDIAVPIKRRPVVADSPSNPPQAMVSVYRPDGSLMWRRDLITSDQPANGIYPISAFSFDGGCTELVFMDTQRLHILNGCDGTTLFEMAVNRAQDGDPTRFPTIADVDNDGGADIVVPTSASSIASAPSRAGVLVLSDTKDNWLNSRRIWNQWMYHVTNIGEDAGIPQVAANNWQGLNTQRAQTSIDGQDPFAAPDLTVSKVTIDTQNCPAGLGITARIGNGGSLHAPAGVNVNFYGGDPASGALLMGTRQTTRALYLGEFEDVTLTGITPPSEPVFVTVNDPPATNLTPSANLSRLPQSWAQASGYIVTSFVPVNNRAFSGIDGQAGTRWTEGGAASTGPSFYEVRFPFPVNAASVIVQNSGGTTTAFLAGSLSFSNGFSTPATLNANGEGTTFFPEQQNVTWIRLTASTTKSSGGSVSEFIVAGSYVEPQFRLNEGDGRLGNNKAASISGIAPCDTAANQPPLINSAPPITAGRGVLYTYQVQASDANNDPLSFSLAAAPTGMTISTAGLISWTPVTTQSGNFTVTVQVSDGRGGSSEQTFTIAVPAPSNRPPVANCHDLTRSADSGSCQVVITPQEVDAASSDLDGDPVTLTLSPAGPYSLGMTSVILIVTDDKGESSQCAATITVNDTTPPTVTAPADINVGADPGQCSANLTPGSATANDDCAGTVNVTGVRSDSQAIDAPYQLGTTTITWTAMDAANNTAAATQSVTVTDVEPPLSSATLSHVANAAGWHNSDVTVDFTTSDAAACSGVREISYSINGAPNTIVQGAAASLLISDEGISTVTYFATDTAGNVETAKTVTIKLDKTAPAINTSRTPSVNQYGWNNSDVTAAYAASDALSGLATDSPASGSQTFTTEGAGQAYTFTVSDLAGNSASFTIGDVNIDKTAPSIGASAAPPANANGWHHTSVTVSFPSGDTLSGLLSSSSPFTLTNEGAGQVATGTATDRAGNTASATLTINIDETAPEAYLQFDPATRDALLFGRDGLSGVSVGPIAPVSVEQIQPSNHHDDEDDDFDHDDDDDDSPGQRRLERRTYRVVDAADNPLMVVVKVKRSAHQVKARILSLQYQDAAVITPPVNREQFKWSLNRDASLKDLQQKMRHGRSREEHLITAYFMTYTNQTKITVMKPGPRSSETRPGLALLRMATNKGRLVIEY